MESNIVFDNAVVVAQKAYPQFCCKLNDICYRDYKRGGFCDKIICIDLDTYERDMNPHSIGNTMDTAIGICNIQNNRRKSKRLLLVELRLDYKSCKNISGSDLKNKSSHSRDLLRGDTDIDRNDVFIFDDKIIDETVKRVDSLAKEYGYSGKWLCMTVNEFNNYVKDSEDIPYKPLNNPDKIIEDLKKCNYNIDLIDNISSKWLEEARNHTYQYNLQESEIICTTALGYLNKLLDTMKADISRNKEDLWFIEEYISEFEGVLSASFN